VLPEYGATERAVRLNGEGFFRVTHDSLRPFTVHTAKGDVRDLGTAFAVTSYPGDSTLRVVVSEGRVRVSMVGEPATSGSVLEHGDVANVGSAPSPRIEHGVDVGQYLGWTQGRLSFYRAPLSDVVVQLGRWYDLRFVIQDSSLRSRRVTMSVSTTSADALVDAMSAALGLHALRRGDTITLRADTHTSAAGDHK
jgi:transmembrane sensor